MLKLILHQIEETSKKIIGTFKNTKIGYDSNQNAIPDEYFNCSKRLKIKNDIKHL